MALDTALFVLGLDTIGVPEPIAITLLTSDTYAIGGVSKTFADCFTTNYTPNDSATVAVVAGEGLSVDFTGGGAATSASATLIATDALETAINPELGFTGVIDVTPVFSGPSEQVFLGPYFTTGTVGFGFDLRPNGGGAHYIAIRDSTFAAPVYIVAAPAVVSGQKYRMAFSIKPNLLMLSVDGAAPVSRVPTAVLDLSVLNLRLYAAIVSGLVGSSARIGDVRYFPLVTDPSVLQRLSA